MDDLEFLKQFNSEPEETNAAGQQVEDQAPAPQGDNVKLDEKSEAKVEDRKTRAKKNNKPLIEPHKVPDLPVPSGPIGLLIALALFLIFAVTPVGPGGDSRLTLLWKAITGQVHIPTPANGANVQGAASIASTPQDVAPGINPPVDAYTPWSGQYTP